MAKAISSAKITRPMQRLLAVVIVLLACSPLAAWGASDADVIHMKVEKVVIEETTITITVSEAKTRITLIRDDYDAATRATIGMACRSPECKSSPTRPRSPSAGLPKPQRAADR